MPGQVQYEYRTLHLLSKWIGWGYEDSEEFEARADQRINELGEEGFEIVSIIHIEDNRGFSVVMKRKKPYTKL